ncbi:MAG: hypothetical protein EA366_05075 [Spirulina sp. DLM2.Bin59]|nr:MAG: hypothetical protein EA366_05075 [Spirulina sp. DLM2.Bin59]
MNPLELGDPPMRYRNPMAQPTCQSRGDRSLAFALLRDCCQTQLGGKPDDGEAMAAHRRGEFPWPIFIELAQWHGVLPLAYHGLKQHYWPAIPPPIQQQLTALFHQQLQRNAQLLLTVKQLLPTLAAVGLPILPIKGVLFALSIYGNLTQRRVRDIDLLVDPEKLAAVYGALQRQGYQESDRLSPEQQARRWETHYEMLLTHPDTGMQIDLHWRLVPAYFGCQVPVADLWQRAKVETHQGITFHQCAPEDLFLILCLNGAKDGWLELQRVCDLVACLRQYPDLNWRQLWQRCQEYAGERVLLMGLAMARALFAIDLPPWLIRELEGDGEAIADRTVARLSGKICQQLERGVCITPSVVERDLFPLQLQRGWVSRGRSLLTLLLPINERDLAWITLPPWLHWLYYPLRILRLLGKYSLGIGGKVLKSRPSGQGESPNP